MCVVTVRELANRRPVVKRRKAPLGILTAAIEFKLDEGLLANFEIFGISSKEMKIIRKEYFKMMFSKTADAVDRVHELSSDEVPGGTDGSCHGKEGCRPLQMHDDPLYMSSLQGVAVVGIAGWAFVRCRLC